MSIRVLLADDQALVRGALAALLSLEDDLEVVGQVGRGDEVNLFNGKVREIAYFGSYTSFVVETPSGRNVVITEPNGSRLENIDITWEDRVFFWWDSADPVVLTQ